MSERHKMAPRTESSTVLHTAPGWVGELVDAPGEEEQPALAQLPILDPVSRFSLTDCPKEWSQGCGCVQTKV